MTDKKQIYFIDDKVRCTQCDHLKKSPAPRTDIGWDYRCLLTGDVFSRERVADTMRCPRFTMDGYRVHENQSEKW